MAKEEKVVSGVSPYPDDSGFKAEFSVRPDGPDVHIVYVVMVEGLTLNEWNDLDERVRAAFRFFGT